MKIGIVTSGNDTLTLFKFLQRYDNEYVIYYDFLNHSYGDKTFEYSLTQIEKGIGFLIKKGCEKIILPPIYELALLNENSKNLSFYRSIVPLFQTYLHQYCFTQSLVGKLGIFGDYADNEIGQKLISQEARNYKLSESQKNTRKFHTSFDFRSKETSLRKNYLDTLSYSDPMVNTVIKHDLQYFKDAGIDTAIPLNYGYFNYQNTITKYFNFKKCRFHKIEKLEEIFTNICPPGQRGVGGIGKPYTVSVFYTNHCYFLLRNKKLLRLLQRGQQIKINFEEIK